MRLSKVSEYIVIGIACLACVAVVSACSETHEDAPPVTPNNIDHGPASVLLFPDGFRNVAFKCDGKNMVYSVSRGEITQYAGSIAVIANDPRCNNG